MNEERQERGAWLLDELEHVVAGKGDFRSVVDEFVASGSGDPDDLRTTFVDMLADIGHWIDEGSDGLEAAVAAVLGGATDSLSEQVAAAVPGIAMIEKQMVAAGIDFEAAARMAAVHVECEVGNPGEP